MPLQRVAQRTMRTGFVDPQSTQFDPGSRSISPGSSKGSPERCQRFKLDGWDRGSLFSLHGFRDGMEIAEGGA